MKKIIYLFSIFLCLMALSLATHKVQAQATGDFRTNDAVTFAAATNWQTYNGTAWIAAATAPTSANGVITIRNHIATVTANVSLDQVVVEGTLQVNNGQTLTLVDGTGDDLFVRNRLVMLGTGVVAGAGQLVFGNQAILTTQSTTGVTGCITSTSPTFAAGMIYEFNGIAAQNTGFPATIGNPLDLVMNNTAGITINRNLTLTGNLNIRTGVTVTVGTGVTTLTAAGIYSRGTINNCTANATITPAFTNAAWAFPKGTYLDNTTTEPTTEATLLYFNQAATTAHIYWTNGDGKNRIVVLKPTSAVSATALTDNIAYTGNAAFGSGTAVDGGFVIYSGNANQVNVTGLTAGTTYHIAVFEYNSDCANTTLNYKTGSPLAGNFVAGNRAFITTWQTTTNGESITIPTTGGGYNYDVNWGDATPNSTGQAVNATHIYATAGTYTVTITGAFPRIFFNLLLLIMF